MTQFQRPAGPVSRIPITEWRPDEPLGGEPFDVRRAWYTSGQYAADTAPDVAPTDCTCDTPAGWAKCPHHGSLAAFDDPRGPQCDDPERTYEHVLGEDGSCHTCAMALDEHFVLRPEAIAELEARSAERAGRLS